MGPPSSYYVPEMSGAALVKLTSFLFWGGLYLGCAVDAPDRSPEWCCRAITLLHGSIATLVGLSQCGVTNLTPYRLTSKLSSMNYALMIWSWGYFAFDLLWCLVFGNESTLMICHHGVALVAISIYMKKTYTGCTYACTVALLEITNPLLQTRWFLRDEGYDKTWINRVVEILFLTLFVFLRAILGTFLIYKILGSELFDMQEKIISFVFYIVSLSFVYEIMGYIFYKYKSQIGIYKQYFVEFWTETR